MFPAQCFFFVEILAEYNVMVHYLIVRLQETVILSESLPGFCLLYKKSVFKFKNCFLSYTVQKAFQTAKRR